MTGGTCSTCGGYLIPSVSGGVCHNAFQGISCSNGRVQECIASSARLAFATQTFPKATKLGNRQIVNGRDVVKKGKGWRKVEVARPTGPDGELLAWFGGSRGGVPRIFVFEYKECL